MKTLILTPNKTEMCGMYQLAKDLAIELDGKVLTKDTIYPYWTKDFDEVITFLYPVHTYGKIGKSKRLKWICYDQKVPPPTKQYFPNFFRRQYMKWFYWANKRSMNGADDYWDVTKREQKPRWTKRKELTLELREWLKSRYDLEDNEGYTIYIGRTTDYKNYDRLCEIMKELDITLVYPMDIMELVRIPTDDDIHRLLSNAKMLVTASLWEGYGRPVMEAEALGVPVVAYDVGTHRQHIKKGIVVSNHDFKAFKKAILEVWNNGSNEI